MKQDNSFRAIVLSQVCADAYSTFRYRSWPTVAKMLINRGLSDREAEAVMRSKWMRWAADSSRVRYGSVPAKAIIEFLDTLTNERAEIEELTKETFGAE